MYIEPYNLLNLHTKMVVFIFLYKKKIPCWILNGTG